MHIYPVMLPNGKRYYCCEYHGFSVVGLTQVDALFTMYEYITGVLGDDGAVVEV